MGNNNEIPEQFDSVIEIKPKGCCDRLSLCIGSNKTDPSDITCSICFRIFDNPRIMKCKHKYCEQCISSWGKGNTATCPFCRIDIKRQRGTFGRIDKKTQKKIEKVVLKCRNCCWEGSSLQYLTTFGVQPFLDDDELPIDKNDCEGEDSCHIPIREEKEENPQLERTATKHKEQQAIKEQVRENQVKIEQKKQTTKALELFLGKLLELTQTGQLDLSQFA